MKEKAVKAPPIVEVEIVKKRHEGMPVGMRLPMRPADAKKLIDAGKAVEVK